LEDLFGEPFVCNYKEIKLIRRKKEM